jgi:hypothetical protein
MSDRFVTLNADRCLRPTVLCAEGRMPVVETLARSLLFCFVTEKREGW